MDVCMTNEEQFRQAISKLDLPKAQLEAICNLHSVIYEGVDWKGIYHTLSHLDDYPKVSKAIKLGSAALIGSAPIHGVYATIDALNSRFGGDDKVIEQQAENSPESDSVFTEPIPVNTDSIQSVDNPDAADEHRDTVELNKGGEDRDSIRDSFDVNYPDKSDTTSTDTALRNFVEANLSWHFKRFHTPDQQRAHIDRVLRAVKNTAKLTASRGIGEAELLALLCVESKFDDKPNTPFYKGIAQLGKDARKDAISHAGEVNLGSLPMRNAEIVEDGINMAASYLLYIMYKTERSNKVNMVKGEEKDDKFHGDMRFVFACYNGGIGAVSNPFDNGNDVSVPQLYRKVLRGEMTPNQAVDVRASMKEALTYPSKIFQVLGYLKSIGMHTNFGPNEYIYSKTTR
jgi:hypothetical protein